MNGGAMDDVMLGDNGEIIQKIEVLRSTFPWMNAIVWKTYPTPFNDKVIRDVRQYDDFDFIQGDDEIHGNDGNDILHGQRGFDKLYGEDGEDELYGELEDDELHGSP
eukprot:8826107-Ditylum_brightwellii.AAC.1